MIHSPKAIVLLVPSVIPASVSGARMPVLISYKMPLGGSAGLGVVELEARPDRGETIQPGACPVYAVMAGQLGGLSDGQRKPLIRVKTAVVFDQMPSAPLITSNEMLTTL